MKVLHIGGTGFLGSHIVRKLIQRNHDLTLITRDPDREMPFDKSEVRFIKGDVLQFDKLEISGKFDVLVYTAMVPFRPGRISNKKFRDLECITRQYFQNTIELARKLSCPLILTSEQVLRQKEMKWRTRPGPLQEKEWQHLERVTMK